MIGQEIVQRVYEAQDKKEEEERALHPRLAQYTHASELGWIDDCPRHLCLKRLCPEKAKGPSAERKRRFAEGKKQEELIRKDLTLAGYQLTRRDLLTWPDLQLVGEIDDEITVNGNTGPIDYKTASSAMFRHISQAQCQADLLKSPHIWIRHYPSQIQAYLLMLRKNLGFLYFKDKESGNLHAIDIPFDPAYASSLLDGLRYVNECIAKEDPPKAEKKEVCEGCGFADFDFPEQEKTSGEIEVVTEEDWLLKLKEYQVLVDSGVQKSVKEFKKLEEEIKDEFRGRTAYVGDHFIESKSYFVPYYDVPEQEKAKYQKQREQFRTSIKLIFNKI
jgi:CRISPR/Cas system-associated exonuclease Cas4 (RecB family)